MNVQETTVSIDWSSEHGKQNGLCRIERRVGHLACHIICLAFLFVIMIPVINVDPWPAFADNVQKKQETQPLASSKATRGGLSSVEKTVISFTNEERKKHGLAPFKTSIALSRVARKHSMNMCRSNIMLHESEEFPRGWRTFQERLSNIGIQSGAENIGYRTWTSDERKWAREVVKGWISSPRHRQNILHPDYTFLGVGIFPCESGIAFATQVFSLEGAGLH